MSTISIKGTEKCIVYKLHSFKNNSKIRGIKTLLGEIKASFDWHNPNNNEIVLLPLLH